MIDKNGKIGGKVSIIDLLILIILVAAIAFVGYRFLTKDRSGVVNTQDVYLSFTGTEVPAYVVDNLELGARVLDDTENNVLGYVTDVQTGKGYHYELDRNGETAAVFPGDTASVTITSLANGTLDDNGLLIGGTRYAIGHTFVLYVGYCKLYLRISALEPAA
ncbi:MAG: DUF4330 family protein [Oscillospiraceae bacterium]|jgi:hypothetical protein|nr:DUF4330 family protein [Oscillospiraceae bacterium]